VSSNTKIIVILIIFLFLILGSCKEKAVSPQIQATGFLTNYEGCKSLATTSGLETSPHSGNVECLEYQYDGQGHLTLKHINSGFNCCPKKIDASISLAEKAISIEEREEEQGCHCLCLFDVSYEFHELEPGTYLIEFRGPYVEEMDEKLRFDIQLYGQCSGAFCVARTHYPWAE